MGKKLNPFKAIVFAASFIFIVSLTGCPAGTPRNQERQVKFAADPEFVLQEEGLAALEAHYDFHFPYVYEMALGLTHEALRAGDVDAAKGFTTDGKIKELDLINLKDDKSFFPASNPAPVIKKDILKQYPKIKDILSEISSRLDTETMIYLNYMADLEEYTPAETAYAWLQKEGLLAEELKEFVNEGMEKVIIGSKEYMEQLILGHITMIALRHEGIPVLDQTQLGDTWANRNALMKGDIHMYWEYTHTAWNTIYEKEETISEAEEIYELVAGKDYELGLIWLDYAPLTKTRTIMMRREHAEQLEISTISGLAAWIRLQQEQNF